MDVGQVRYAGGVWSSAFPPLDGERTLVLVFAAPGFAHDRAPLAALARAYPRAALIGCSTAGEIDGPRVDDDSLLAAIIRFERTPLRAARVPLAAAADSLEAGAALARALVAPDLRAVFVLARGHDVNGSALIRGLAGALPAGVVVTGGLAGGGLAFGPTFVLDRDDLRGDAVVAVGLYGDHVRVGHASRGGWDTFGPERRVTRSEGNVLYELDGRPALALYREYLGARAAELPRSALLFPMLVRPDRDRDERVVRSVLGIDEAAQALVLVGEVPQGAYAKLMRANFDRLILGAQQAAASVTGVAAPALCVAISCVGRRLVLGERAEEELEAARDALAPGVVQLGFYSNGEISPHASGRCDLHNQTLTLTLLSEAG